MKTKDLFKKIKWWLFGPSDEFIILAQGLENIQADFKKKFDELNDSIDNHREYFNSAIDFHKSLYEHQLEELIKIPAEKQVIRKSIKCTIATAPKNKPSLKRIK
jgi:hypothetical protein